MAKRKRGNRSALVPYRAEQAAAQQKAPSMLPVTADNRGGWVTVWDSAHDDGWFQKDLHVNRWKLQQNWVVFACQTLIAGDIGKLRPTLVEQDANSGVWVESQSAPYNKLLSKPNGFQTWQQFAEHWSLSKQRRGNAYILKERDLATKVRAMYVLDPDRVTPLVAPDGSVYYRLMWDWLAGIEEGNVVFPASEIMHDRFNCLFHPLVGLSPLFASALAASHGLTIQEQSQIFFRNGSRPAGLLTTPGFLDEKTQKLYKKEWEINFGGQNLGRTAVLGNGLKYEAIRENAVDSELIGQMNISAEMVCSTYHVPSYKVGVGQTPTYQNAEILNQIYYDDCLQKLLEAIEVLLNEGLELASVSGRTMRAQFDLAGLLRMDSATRGRTLGELVQRGIMAPNEARAEFGLQPVKGGDLPYLQQQNFSLEALAKRDALPNPFVLDRPTVNPTPSAGGSPVEVDPADPTDGGKAADTARVHTAEILEFASKALNREAHAS